VYGNTHPDYESIFPFLLKISKLLYFSSFSVSVYIILVLISQIPFVILFKYLLFIHVMLNIFWNVLVVIMAAAAAAKSLQSCPTLCDPIDGSPPGSPVPGILQTRTLEWVAISFSNAWKWKVKVKSLSRVLLLATPWTAAYQAPPSKGFSRQEYWSGVPLPSPSLWLSFGIIEKFM